MYKTNTHELYNTINHEHLDDLVSWAVGKYPDSGLCLVECKDGQWFIEVDYGHTFDSTIGLSKPKIKPYSEPYFYSNRESALAYAIKLIKHMYPSVTNTKIQDYYNLQRDDN